VLRAFDALIEKTPDLISMCNLYSMTRNREAILRLFRISHNRAVAVDPLPAIFPGYQAPVVVKNIDSHHDELGLYAVTKGPRPSPCHQRARRYDPNEEILARFFRTAALPREARGPAGGMIAGLSYRP
jgi:hypothetical protein